MDKFLFEKFNKDKRIYNLNQGYWTRKLQSKLKIKLSEENVLFKNLDSDGQKIYDANPIFTYINSDKSKAIRIIQDDIKSFKEETNIRKKYLMAAWFDKISIYEANDLYKGERKIDELVIALFLTRDTVEKTMKLIIKWLNHELNEENIDYILEQ